MVLEQLNTSRSLRAVGATLAVAAALSLTHDSKAQYIPPVVYIENTSDLPQAELADALPAFQQAIDEDFAPEWNAPATLELLEPGQQAPKGKMEIDLVNEPDCWSCAGFHSTKENGKPYSIVGTETGIPWQLVFTHELFEMLADPNIDRASFHRDVQCIVFSGCQVVKSTAWVVEVADPVEKLHFAYNHKSASGENVIISDFVTQRWYTGEAHGKKDFLGYVKRSHQVLDGGYAWKFDGPDWERQMPKINGRPAAIYGWEGDKD